MKKEKLAREAAEWVGPYLSGKLHLGPGCKLRVRRTDIMHIIDYCNANVIHHKLLSLELELFYFSSTSERVCCIRSALAFCLHCRMWMLGLTVRLQD